ncbi:MAG TPA: glycoside hydrolase family 27 protein [Bryobacteraceae bacterium]|nr:glycoside hydrolase family 27 protein [Bryobacteraceae bacterium]
MKYVPDRILIAFCALLFVPVLSRAQLAATPPMGWNSWETFRLNISEQLIRSIADAMVATGMKEAGYEYVIVDAGWKAAARNADGTLAVNAARFPSGMKVLGDYIHARGLKFGLYTDAGRKDCVAGTPGSLGHEETDARTFAAWGVDFVKEDWCNSEGLNARAVYYKMYAALRATGRPIVFSICEWGDNKPWQWAPAFAQMWRTTGDDKPCWDCGRETMNKPGGYPRGWTLILDAQIPLARYAAPGHWNDPDMLEVGQPGLTIEESRAQFSLWAILAAPLIATNDLRSMRPAICSILLNKQVIAVDQDKLGRQGHRISSRDGVEIWIRELSGGDRAIVLFNRNERERAPHFRWSEIGGAGTLRDLWRDTAVPADRNGFKATIPAHGVRMFRIHPHS